MRIQDSVVLVTGANRGLGAAFVRAALAAGARRVYAAARDPSGLADGHAVPVRLDITSSPQVEAAARECGDVTLLINNAGIARPCGVLAEGMPAHLRDELDTNLFGPLAMARAFAPVLQRHGGGAIVNVLSVLSWISLPGLPGYCISKSAAWSATNALRHALRPQRTQVLGVHVGYMDTEMTQGLDAPKAAPADVVQRVFSALAAGDEEVCADELSRQVRGRLSADPGVHLLDPQ